ncbi:MULTISPECIES: hypothetical protein [Streptomyces]|uniref:Putative integral membrane protein n=1 Tax=Streptomyces scabiei (strain 87.22) TaxID=680198 RepID=C9Z4B5_STRSW|nr:MULTISPECIES: hypothetical protein [Streptomyces]MBP5863586.1 hypothetical protein [Streptomyces sp. LBUM 1484]MBP5867443.1 hypothetical protein [Streptomyces sp. LBUM 1485]MBP5906064.1 hypothetical protein [Streptomyces sp. LBUM 1478]MBP5931382.1 hypothetical protein [Streptomyces sp. LBUM 1479]KFG03289.1 hypothetical protein IQ61_41825 [Streptomyces scabiei]
MGTLWITAAVAGVALATVFASLFPSTRRGKWEAVLLVLAVAAYAALRGLPEDEDGEPRMALLLFIAVAINFALNYAAFARWSKRQDELIRLGRPIEKLKARHYALMTLALAVSMAVVIPLR